MSSVQDGRIACPAGIVINALDGIPIYRQIANQVGYLVASEVLRPGAELPPIRALAKHLKVAPNTIVKAYDELANARVVHKRQGAGTYVAAVSAQVTLRDGQQALERRIDVLLAQAAQLNVSADLLVNLIWERKGRMACETIDLRARPSTPAADESPGDDGAAIEAAKRDAAVTS